MKKLSLVLLFLTTSLFAKLNVVVSILPEKTFLKAIGGDKVNVDLMVRPGNSPHTYEPKPSQMKAISKANIYFAIDVEFEDTWLAKFQSINPGMSIVDLDQNIIKIPMQKHAHHEGYEHHTEHEEHEHHGLDPHIWTNTQNVKIMAKTIFDTLVKNDPQNKNYYKTHYEKFLKEITNTENTITSILKDTQDGTKFMVFHPSWGYFAKQFHLQQFTIEIEGKKPKPKQITYLLEEAKEENVKAIFTSPEFNENIAKQIANELQIPVIKVSPLNPKWSENLINLAKSIANKK